VLGSVPSDYHCITCDTQLAHNTSGVDPSIPPISIYGVHLHPSANHFFVSNQKLSYAHKVPYERSNRYKYSLQYILIFLMSAHKTFLSNQIGLNVPYERS
jgi:hypothetical protein